MWYDSYYISLLSEKYLNGSAIRLQVFRHFSILIPPKHRVRPRLSALLGRKSELFPARFRASSTKLKVRCYYSAARSTSAAAW